MKKVLVVDDSGLTRQQVRAMLESCCEVEVLTAEDGQQALELLGRDPDVELIITDIEMPVLGGVELVRRIRAAEETMYLPVLVMSTLGQVRERDSALNSGADAFIEKPVTPEALEQRLRDLL